MTITLAPLDDDDLGTDIALTDDLAPVMGIASGRLAVAQAVYRRLTTPRGGLFYDPDYGYDVRELVNSEISPSIRAAHKSEIAHECRKEETVESARVVFDFDAQTRTLDVIVELDTATGPFDLVIRVTQVTAELLRVAGVALAALERPDAIAIQVPGPQGPTGATGSGGGGSSAGAPLFNASAEKVTSPDPIAELVVFQDDYDFGLLPATITVQLTAAVYSETGTATFRVRIGGSDGAADGTSVLSLTRVGASFADGSGTATIANPTGIQKVKITAENGADGAEARIKDAALTLG